MTDSEQYLSQNLYKKDKTSLYHPIADGIVVEMVLPAGINTMLLAVLESFDVKIENFFLHINIWNLPLVEVPSHQNALEPFPTQNNISLSLLHQKPCYSPQGCNKPFCMIL